MSVIMLKSFLSTRRRYAGETSASHLIRGEDGSMAVYSMYLLLMMLAVAGMSLDFMRYETHRASLQATLDRAVLAAASLEQPLDPQAVVLDYFDKAGLSEYISPDDIHVVDVGGVRKVSATAERTIGTRFLGLVGIGSLTAPAAAAAQETISNTEVSLVLDVSGSMKYNASGSYQSKIAQLREAATAFVNILMCNPSDSTATTNCTVEPGLVSMNLINYDQQVVAGEALLSAFNSTEEHTYSSCATFAPGDFSSAAITPNTPVQRAGHFDRNSRGSSAPSEWECPVTDNASDKWHEIGFMEGDASVLRSQISQLQAEFGRRTSIDLGMKWATALLDPSIQPIVADLSAQGEVDARFASRPARGSGTQKVIVLMTDGQNTWQFYLRDGYYDGPSNVWKTAEKVSSGGSSEYRYSLYDPGRGAYYWESEGIWQDHPYGTQATSFSVWSCEGRGRKRRCGTTWINEQQVGASELSFPDLWAQKTAEWYEQFSFTEDVITEQYGGWQKDQNLAAICTAAKSEGITVFTVGFDVSGGAADVMRNCASGDAFYFDADGSNLVSSFAAIAADISKLRLVN
ncbi:MAG: pilus assembly protein TadG-related protein [Maritimibacter sp.]